MICDRLHAWWLTCYKVNSSYSAVIAVNTCTMVIGCAMAHPCTYKCALFQLVVIIHNFYFPLMIIQTLANATRRLIG